MEPFSIATGVLQVAGAGVQLAKTLYSCGRTIKAAEREINGVALQVKLTSGVLESLGMILKTEDARGIANDNLREDLETAMTACKVSFAELNTALQTAMKTDRQGKAVMTMSIRAKWPLNKARMKSLQEELKKLKDDIHLMLSVLNYASRGPQQASTQQDNSAQAQRQEIELLIKSNQELCQSLMRSFENHRISEPSVADQPRETSACFMAVTQPPEPPQRRELRVQQLQQTPMVKEAWLENITTDTSGYDTTQAHRTHQNGELLSHVSGADERVQSEPAVPKVLNVQQEPDLNAQQVIERFVDFQRAIQNLGRSFNEMRSRLEMRQGYDAHAVKAACSELSKVVEDLPKEIGANVQESLAEFYQSNGPVRSNDWKKPTYPDSMIEEMARALPQSQTQANGGALGVAFEAPAAPTKASLPDRLFLRSPTPVAPEEQPVNLSDLYGQAEEIYTPESASYERVWPKSQAQYEYNRQQTLFLELQRHDLEEELLLFLLQAKKTWPSLKPFPRSNYHSDLFSQEGWRALRMHRREVVLAEYGIADTVEDVQQPDPIARHCDLNQQQSLESSWLIREPATSALSHFVPATGWLPVPEWDVPPTLGQNRGDFPLDDVDSGPQETPPGSPGLGSGSAQLFGQRRDDDEPQPPMNKVPKRRPTRDTLGSMSKTAGDAQEGRPFDSGFVMMAPNDFQVRDDGVENDSSDLKDSQHTARPPGAFGQSSYRTPEPYRYDNVPADDTHLSTTRHSRRRSPSYSSGEGGDRNRDDSTAHRRRSRSSSLSLSPPRKRRRSRSRSWNRRYSRPCSPLSPPERSRSPFLASMESSHFFAGTFSAGSEANALSGRESRSLEEAVVAGSRVGHSTPQRQADNVVKDAPFARPPRLSLPMEEVQPPPQNGEPPRSGENAPLTEQERNFRAELEQYYTVPKSDPEWNERRSVSWKMKRYFAEEHGEGGAEKRRRLEPMPKEVDATSAKWRNLSFSGNAMSEEREAGFRIFTPLGLPEVGRGRTVRNCNLAGSTNGASDEAAGQDLVAALLRRWTTVDA